MITVYTIPRIIASQQVKTASRLFFCITDVECRSSLCLKLNQNLKFCFSPFGLLDEAIFSWSDSTEYRGYKALYDEALQGARDITCYITHGPSSTRKLWSCIKFVVSVTCSGFQPREMCALGDLARSGDIFGCQSWLTLVIWLYF